MWYRNHTNNLPNCLMLQATLFTNTYTVCSKIKRHNESHFSRNVMEISSDLLYNKLQAKLRSNIPPLPVPENVFCTLSVLKHVSSHSSHVQYLIWSAKDWLKHRYRIFLSHRGIPQTAFIPCINLITSISESPK